LTGRQQEREGADKQSDPKDDFQREN
jgi:hypothetical protein